MLILETGDLEFALQAAQGAVQERSRDAKLWQLLALVNARLGRHRSAQAALQRAAELQPGDPEIQENLRAVKSAAALAELNALTQALGARDFTRAVSLAQQALRRSPRDGACHNNLAAALAAAGQLPQAIASARRAVQHAPASVEFQRNLAQFLEAERQSEQALQAYRRVFELKPDDERACRALARAAAQQGRLAEARFYCSGGAEGWSQDLALFSNQLYYLTLDASVSAEEGFAAHAEYGRRSAQAAADSRFVHANDRDPSRRLKVGFVSGDLYSHAVAGFIEPVWAALDREQVEIWVYANLAAEDEVTQRLQRLAGPWCNVAAMSDAELARRIHDDGVDVLFDLSGHTGGHRLMTFAMKPAPLQVTWIGYPNTTGLPTMDYALCDRFNAPPGLYETYYVEKFARIPCSGTFEPMAGLPDVGPLPAASRGHITFGSFNATRKIGDVVLAAWARVLHAVPASRLLVGHVTAPEEAARLARAFADAGITADRLEFHGHLPIAAYLALHQQVDLVLDSWPYTGGTTTNYALAMGVPVVTLRGPGRAHCQSAGVLGRIGLHDWVADDVDDFVVVAVRQAQDAAGLARLRAGLRARWRDTPLRQPASVASGLEKAVRVMWQRWCAGLPAANFEVTP
jgi:protein O-GlcNAc transferase